MIQNEMNEKMINANHALEILHEYISYRIYLISGIMEISYSFNMSDLEPYASPQKIAIYLAVMIIKNDKVKYRNFVLLGIILASAILNRPENMILSLLILQTPI